MHHNGATEQLQQLGRLSLPALLGQGPYRLLAQIHRQGGSGFKSLSGQSFKQMA
jgi:hypothetical protein